MGTKKKAATTQSKPTPASEDSTSSSKKRKVKNPAAKGKQFENWVATQLGHIFPEMKRKLEYQAAANVEEGGIDLEDCDRLKIQCKNWQGYASVSTIKEIRTKDPNHIPILVTKGNRMEPMAVLPFEKLVTLLEIAYGIALPFRTFEEPTTRTQDLLTMDKYLRDPKIETCVMPTGTPIDYIEAECIIRIEPTKLSNLV